jgi:hypothetical protein
MKYLTLAAWGAFVGLILMMPLASVAWAGQPGESNRQGVEPQSHLVVVAANQPVYEPPLRSAPGGRVGGSTRGIKVMPLLSVLAPDHTGLTIQEQPSLFWYLAGATTYPVELTITDERTAQPLFETQLTGPIQPGVQRFRLADYGVQLAQDVPYRWSVGLVVDPTNPARDNVASGTVERVALQKALRTKLARAGKAQAPSIYAQAGLWYDALAASSDLVDAAPNDAGLRQQRNSLLEQVGLRQVAEHDMRRSATQ